jgi:hypothetical protein
MRYHLVRSSSNRKTGPIPVSITSSDTCPDACGLKASGCYANSGPLKIHWRRVDNGRYGVTIDEFCQEIKKLPRNILWRHNTAGDLPGTNNKIDTVSLKKLVEANKGKQGFTYTHKPLNKKNLEAIKHANANGFTVNVSTDTLSDADKSMALSLPTVTIVPHDAPRGLKTPDGRVVAICPAQLNELVSCSNCGLCQKSVRNYVIGFRAHGVSYKRAETLSKEDIQRRALIQAAIDYKNS